MENLASIILLAGVVEGTITYFKTFVVKREKVWEMIASLALGAIVTIAYQLDLLAMVGLESSIPYVGNILTGIVISRGSNFICDLINLTRGVPMRKNSYDTYIYDSLNENERG